MDATFNIEKKAAQKVVVEGNIQIDRTINFLCCHPGYLDIASDIFYLLHGKSNDELFYISFN